MTNPSNWGIFCESSTAHTVWAGVPSRHSMALRTPEEGWTDAAQDQMSRETRQNLDECHSGSNRKWNDVRMFCGAWLLCLWVEGGGKKSHTSAVLQE